MQTYDLVIIGSGSGNSLVTSDFDDKSVAVVEESVFGGTCLNVGCIPTKMFVYTAELAKSIAGMSRYGVDARLDHVRWRDIRDRIFDRIDPISHGGRDYRIHGPNTTAYLGHGHFVSDRDIEVEITGADGEHPIGSTQRISGEQVVIATGGRPVIPVSLQEANWHGDAADREVLRGLVHTSDTVMRIEELPRRAVIVGGGYVAMEFAHILTSLGVGVSVILRASHALRQLDAELSDLFTAQVAQRWDVRAETEVESLARHGQGARLRLTDGSVLDTDLVLVATGREPNSDRLGLEHTGVRTHDDGRIEVDEFGRTAVPGIWALGDVSSPYQLKHVANHEARVVAHNLTHPDDLRAVDHRYVPSAVFTDPQVATVGMTEAQAHAAGHQVVTALQDYGSTAYGWAMEDTRGLVKLVGDAASGLILGAHYLGPHASSLIQPVIQAMSFGQRPQEVARGQYWIHPALMEVTENALLALAERMAV